VDSDFDLAFYSAQLRWPNYSPTQPCRPPLHLAATPSRRNPPDWVEHSSLPGPSHYHPWPWPPCVGRYPSP
jgi:hypothetical protein